MTGCGGSTGFTRRGGEAVAPAPGVSNLTEGEVAEGEQG